MAAGGMAAAGLLALSAASPAAANPFDCRASGFVLGGTPSGPTVANLPYTPCKDAETASPINIVAPAAPEEPRIRLQTFYARTVLKPNRYTQSYAAAGIVQIGPKSGSHLLIEELEASATAGCRTLASNGGVTDVHLIQAGDPPSDTVINIGNGFDWIEVPGLGRVEFNRVVQTNTMITRTAVTLIDTHGPTPVTVAEVARAEAGRSGSC